MTPKALGLEIDRRSGHGASADLQALHRALTAFTQAAYGDGDGQALDGTSLDASLATVRRLARRLTLEHAWPVRRLAPVIRRWQRSAPP
jgi:hypothetical protein